MDTCEPFVGCVHTTGCGFVGGLVGPITPADVATDAAGNVYVADTGNDRIQKFTAAGAYLTQWGSAGSGSEQLNGPRGVAADGGGNVYVADTSNDRVQKFACP